jgi:hypothetical protein
MNRILGELEPRHTASDLHWDETFQRPPDLLRQRDEEYQKRLQWRQFGTPFPGFAAIDCYRADKGFRLPREFPCFVFISGSKYALIRVGCPPAHKQKSKTRLVRRWPHD